MATAAGCIETGIPVTEQFQCFAWAYVAQQFDPFLMTLVGVSVSLVGGIVLAGVFALLLRHAKRRAWSRTEGARD